MEFLGSFLTVTLNRYYRVNLTEKWKFSVRTNSERSAKVKLRFKPVMALGLNNKGLNGTGDTRKDAQGQCCTGVTGKMSTRQRGTKEKGHKGKGGQEEMGIRAKRHNNKRGG